MSFTEALVPARSRLLAHPIYAAVNTRARLRVFMEHHVFAVWDFMSLLKALQRALTCVTTPWLPPRDRVAARMVNEIVLGEESDEDGRGGFASHFQLYLDAMTEVGADRAPIERTCAALADGAPLAAALAHAPAAARSFVEHTLAVVAGGNAAAIAAAFAYGREDVIPEMFTRLVQGEPGAYPRLRHYLARHIEVDGDAHGPASHALVDRLCTDEAARRAALRAAEAAVEARIALWDGVLRAL